MASPDQASGLRLVAGRPAVRTIAVTGGKGGVGKTTIAINLATAFAELGRRAMLLDADLGLANVDVMLGVRARLNLEHVVAGECALGDIVVTTRTGLRIVPASTGNFEMATLSPAQHAGVIGAFNELLEPIDVLLVDTAAGISESVMTYTGASHHVIVALCDEPASLTDAYGLIKTLRRRQPDTEIRIVANMVETAAQGRSLYDKLARVTNRFLHFVPRYLGSIPYDDFLRRSVQAQRAVVECYPWSVSATAFKKFAVAADKWPMAPHPRGGIEFFVDRLLRTGPQRTESSLQ